MTEAELYQKLEYDKILEFIAENTRSVLAKKSILNHKPFSTKRDAVRYGELVSVAKRLLEEGLEPPYAYEDDLTEHIVKSRIEGITLEPKTILKIADLLFTARAFSRYLKNTEQAETLCEEFCDLIYTDALFENSVAKIIGKNGEVKDSASPRLREIRREISEKNIQLNRVAEKKLRELSKAKVTQEDFLTLHDGRYVIPVKAEYKRQIRGFIHSESATGQTVYIEPEEILNLNNEIISLGFEEKREIRRLLTELTKRVAVISEELVRTQNALAEVEKIFAAAKFSLKYNCAYPQVDERKPIEILQARHPVLLRSLGEKRTIPLDLKFEDYKVILITGPNAGGKTVVLKTVGILNLLVKSGLHIPASPDSNFHFFEKIMIDIGDEQSIEENLSTFSSHLSNIKKILDEADGESLVLLDEIGTGTDPTEGAALAAAILLELAERGARVLATTHHGNLKSLASETEGFQNASLEFDLERIEPTFRLLQGEPGASYAFEVAKRIGLSDELISSAKKFIDESANKTEELLVELQKRADTLGKKLRDIELENTRLRGLANLYERKTRELTERKKKILDEAKKEAAAIISEANRKIEKAIKEIREKKGARDTIKKAKTEIENFKKKIVSETERTPPEDLREGDYVKITATSTEGVIESIDKKKNVAVVRSGALRISVKLGELQKTKKRKKNNESFSKINYYSQLQNLRLDIRGKKPEEIEFEVVRFIDDAYATNNKEVEILHGKGTGALKEAVHKLLREHEFVKEFHFAKIEVGGEGITVVKLK